MVSLCEELHIALLSIESKPWQVAYFMRTTECRSAVRFNYNKNGEITYAEPASEKGNADEKLRQLVDRLKSSK